MLSVTHLMVKLEIFSTSPFFFMILSMSFITVMVQNKSHKTVDINTFSLAWPLETLVILVSFSSYSLLLVFAFSCCCKLLSLLCGLYSQTESFMFVYQEFCCHFSFIFSRSSFLLIFEVILFTM